MNQMPRGPLMAGRFLMGTVGLVFFGIGLTILIFMWGGFDDSPPVFFRIFASFIALAFMAFGGTAALGAWRSGDLLSGNFANVTQVAEASRIGASAEKSNYACPGCGATLAENAEVSPLGDVKCGHCGRWFNVHKPS